ncbi:low molecular weight protein-tyrosine-phosphatase [Xylanibacter muris]|uniref:protein-tyrosine-phosphatase n=1 Tax=Xylanibacter muris TaxID=2736290 RepID=A0ABX2AN23_9BACT|nr:low molecular weight protein-tyrosine-phosphatase [Xylanibacter muris]NPD92409.1 low molecular weight phosphotyrosine protein phosphatase [Xylanibacter muris]
MKKKLLFICLGNICRSPAAEGIMKHIVKEHGMEEGFLIDSAGIGSWHVGQLPDSRMRRHGASHGYKFDSHARQFSKKDFSLFDIIIVMDKDNLRAVTSMAENSEEKGKVRCMADFLVSHKAYTYIPDPYYGNDKDFELVIELLEDACNGLLDVIIKQ